MRAVLGDFLRTWPQLVLTDLLSRAVVLLVVAPLIGLLFALFLAGAQDQVLTDTEIAAFALHPLGLGCFLLVGAISLAVYLARLSLMMVIGFGAVEQRSVSAPEALRYVLRRAGGFGRLASRVLLRLVLLGAPFLAAVGGVYLSLLGEHDINYYLVRTPPVFWVALALCGLLLAVLALLVLRLLAGWLLALPLLLFGQLDAREALRRSSRVTRTLRARIAFCLLAWLALLLAASSLVTFLIGQLGGLLVPDFDGGLAPLAIGLALTLTVAGLANLGLAILGDSLLPLAIVRLYRGLAGPGALAPSISERGSLAERSTLDVSGRALLSASLLALLAIPVAGYFISQRLPAPSDAEIIAHRGASGRAPENTMAAFECALEDAADWIELDVQESADGELIVTHDSDFMKQARVGLKVWEASSADLATIDIGSWYGPGFADQRVPTLRQVLVWARGRIGVVVELKYYGHDQELERRVVELVEQLGVQSQIQLMSLRREGLEKLGELRPEWRRGLLNTASLGDLTRMRVDFLALNAAAASRAQIRQAHERGMQVYVWTINDPVQMSVMLSRGADGLITDEPALAREVLELRAELSPLGRLLVWIAGAAGLLHGGSEASAEADA